MVTVRRGRPSRHLVGPCGEPVGCQGKREECRGTKPAPHKGLETLEVRMKLVKSLLLGSAAGLAAVAGAQAADLPVRKAAPVEYVRVCSAYGVGFFYIPGTETCLRVSGFARFEYNV